MNSITSSAKERAYSIDFNNQNINSANISRIDHGNVSKRKPKLMQNHKVVQKLFNVKSNTI